MDGISFIIRVRNEEATLDQSIRSLFGLTIPHEIIVILHRCTDNSRGIVERIRDEGHPIQILEYTHVLSRAGVETLATDMDSQHSLMTFYNWSFSTGMYDWKFKWDADFIASPDFIEYLNIRNWKKPDTNTKIFFIAKSYDTENIEGYLYSGNFHYTKYYFWECVECSDPWIRIDSNICIEHASKISNMKSYWTEESWFMHEDSDEARLVNARLRTIQEVCGKEPLGQARAGDPNNWVSLGPAIGNQELLEHRGVYAFR